MRKIRGRLFALFLLFQCAAMVLAGALLLPVNNYYVREELLEDENALRLLTLELEKKTALSAEEILQMAATSAYSLREAQTDFTNEEIRLLESGFAVTRGSGSGVRMYFRLRDAYVCVRAKTANPLLVSSAMRYALGCVLAAAFGLALALFALRAMTRPVLELTHAAREIARGNFDVSVSEQTPIVRKTEELAELFGNFNRMARELKSVEYLRRDFTSSVSHEIKTPLASIQGYARLLQCEGLSGEERREYAGVIAAESARLSGLADNLLRLSRLESQDVRLRVSRFALDEQLRAAVLALHPQIEKRGQRVEVALKPTLIAADEELLSHVWENLLQNAVKFTPAGGTITLTLARAQGQAVVCVRDTGIGMDAQTAGRVFEKFYQADESRHTGGCGLGLSLVKRIVDISGGTIAVESEPGRGSAFTVRLPLEQPE